MKTIKDLTVKVTYSVGLSDVEVPEEVAKQLELSDSKVARAIQKSTSAATHKRMRLRDNKFTDEDFQRIRDFYLEKLRNIEKL